MRQEVINYNTYSDEDLLGMLSEGKPLCDHAFYVLYNRYSVKLNSFCVFFCESRENSEDVFQESWIKFDKAVKTGAKIKNVHAYLITTARNLAIDLKRKQSVRIKKNKIENSDATAISGSYSADKTLEQEELLGLIKTAADSLDDKYKETFILKRFCDMSYKEIAAITGDSVGSVKKRSSRAMEMVKEILKPYIKEFS